MTMVSDKGMGSTAIWGIPVEAGSDDTERADVAVDRPRARSIEWMH